MTKGLKRKDPEPEAPAVHVPGADEFTPRAVHRAVLSETLQHPATILPAAVSAVSGLYLGLINLDPTAFAVTFAGALVAAGAWIFNYFIRGEDLARQHVEDLHELRRKGRLGEAFNLAAEWESTGHAEGIQQARELGEAYAKLEAFLKERVAESSGTALGNQRLLVLAEDTYREGVAILRKALDLCRALSRMDKDKLQRELEDWRVELGRLRLADVAAGSVESAQMKALETKIAAHERRLALHDEHTRSLQKLLAQSEELEAALESTCLEAANLGSADALFASGNAASELERAVDSARRVEERLRGLGDAEHREEDEIYLSAGRTPG